MLFRLQLKPISGVNGKLIKELGKIDHNKPIHIKFGEPFRVTGNGKEENQKIIDFIQSALKEWK